MNKMVLSAVVVAGFTAPLSAFADMAAVDTDADGMINLEEMSAAYPAMTPEGFAELDVDQDGNLSTEELARAHDLGLLPKSEG